MALYCLSCGVEVNKKRKACPLCGGGLSTSRDPGDEISRPFFPPPESRTKREEPSDRTGDHRPGRFLWILVTVFLAMSLSVMLTILLKYEQSYSWVYYPLFSIVFAWLSFTNTVFLLKKPLIMTVIQVLFVNIFMLLLGYLQNSLRGYLGLVLPISAVFLIMALLFVLVACKIREKSWNIIGIFMLFVGVFFSFLEIIVNLYIRKTELLSWSLFVMSVTVPLALFFLYIHYVLGKTLKFKRYFHM